LLRKLAESITRRFAKVDIIEVRAMEVIPGHKYVVAFDRREVTTNDAMKIRRELLRMGAISILVGFRDIDSLKLIDITDADGKLPGRKCRVCACTDNSCDQCVAKTGLPCSWVEYDLCSACAALAAEKFKALNTDTLYTA